MRVISYWLSLIRCLSNFVEMPPLSILDLAFVPEDGTPADALRNTLDLAQHAERWGYRRFCWRIDPPKVETKVVVLSEETIAESIKTWAGTLMNTQICETCSHLVRSARS